MACVGVDLLFIAFTSKSEDGVLDVWTQECTAELDIR